jgi:hypothetical protein
MLTAHLPTARRRFSTLAAVTLLAGASGKAEAASSDDWVDLGKAGGWDITADASVCMGSKSFANGTTLYFSINADGRALIMIGNPQWKIPKGSYPITLSVDRVPPVTFDGSAKGTVVSVSWKLAPEEINLVSHGAVLYATVGKAEYHYNLAGSADMLAALGRCAGDRMALQKPFSGTQPATPAYQPTIIKPFAGN